jgi:hypothetical protein
MTETGNDPVDVVGGSGGPTATSGDGADATSAQLVSQLAQEQAERRHAEAQRAAQREHPDFVLDIERSDVVYTLPPRFMPLEHVEFDKLRRLLHDKWGLTLDLSSLKLDAVLGPRSIEQVAGLSEDELMQLVLRSGDPNIAFGAGKYPVSDFDFVPVLGVRLNYESVMVKVAGVSRVAEVVAAELVEAVSTSAGAARPWSDIEPHLQRVGYATATRINLGAPFEALLSTPTRRFLDEQMIDGPRYAAHMGYYHARPRLGPPPRAVCTYALDDLSLRFAWFDPETGVSTATNMKFSVTSKADYRSGIVLVWSELPYDIHVACLEQLIAGIREQQ